MGGDEAWGPPGAWSHDAVSHRVYSFGRFILVSRAVAGKMKRGEAVDGPGACSGSRGSSSPVWWIAADTMFADPVAVCLV